jgi:hypothetical protein
MTEPVRAKLIPDGPETTDFGTFNSGHEIIPYAARFTYVTQPFRGCRVWLDDGTDLFISDGQLWVPTGGDAGYGLEPWIKEPPL